MAVSHRSDRPAAQAPRRVVIAIAGFSTYAREVARGAREYALSHGPTELMIFPEVNLPDQTQRIARLAEHVPLSGIIAEIWSTLKLKMNQLGIPLVEVTGTWNAKDLTSVHADDAIVGRLGAEYLINKGLKSFAFTGTPSAMHSRRRQAAFIDVIHQAGYPCSVYDRAPTESLVLIPEEADYRAWIRSLPKPVGIMGWTDTRANDVLYACGREGFRVPDDVAMICIGNDELFCESFQPTLSSIDLNPRGIGHRAMEVLYELMSGNRRPGGDELVAPNGVVERASSKILNLSNADVARAIRFIEEHLGQRLGIDDLLGQVSMSRRAFEGHFRKLFGRGPMEHVRHLRLERAKSLLRTTHLPIQEVARRCGFADSATFCIAFRKTQQMTPGECRNQSVPPDGGTIKS